MRFFRKIGLWLGVTGSLLGYFWRNKMWWLVPMIALLVIFGAILIIGQSTPLGAFIYTIF